MKKHFTSVKILLDFVSVKKEWESRLDLLDGNIVTLGTFHRFQDALGKALERIEELGAEVWDIDATRNHGERFATIRPFDFETEPEEHLHAPVSSKTIERPFTGCLCPDQCNPSAHGGFSVVETCRCGFVRASNVNQKHVESGRWTEPEGTTREKAIRLAASLFKQDQAAGTLHENGEDAMCIWYQSIRQAEGEGALEPFREHRASMEAEYDLRLAEELGKTSASE
ncbi:MAG: hypothetical protein WC350_06115 [Candidatus Micrarchaeia archaeon]|jgi:hypothetical protein